MSINVVEQGVTAGLQITLCVRFNEIFGIEVLNQTCYEEIVMSY